MAEKGKEVEERLIVTIQQLDIVIKECKKSQSASEEKVKEEHDAQLREKRYNEEIVMTLTLF